MFLVFLMSPAPGKNADDDTRPTMTTKRSPPFRHNKCHDKHFAVPVYWVSPFRSVKVW